MTPHLVRTYAYALRPTRSQARALARELERQRLLYNAAHEERRGSYRWARGQAALHDALGGRHGRRAGVNVAQKRGLNRAIAGAAMARYARDVGDKAESAGLRVVAVDPRWTSRTCSSCGVVDPDGLSGRAFACRSCGLVIDRDVNAAINVRDGAVALYAPRRVTERTCSRRKAGEAVVRLRAGKHQPVLGRDGEGPGRVSVRVSN